MRDLSRDAATLTVSVHVSNDDSIPRSFHMKNTLLDAAGLDVASSRSERDGDWSRGRAGA
ncbi:MAG: hypothetical protein MZV63_53655 [Marinilabiliales bacterium]|nr:hypothetical protein [Marinilabiliales bacterium]